MKTDANFEIVKESIVKASREVFKRFGYSKVSMDDISKASGKGRSTVYHYFKSKQDVFEAFAISEFTNMLLKAKQVTSPEASITKNLLSYKLTKLTCLTEFRNEYEIVVKDLREQEQFNYQLNRLINKKEAEIVKYILTLATSKGEISPIGKEDLEFLVEALVLAFNSFDHEIIVFNEIEVKSLEHKMKWLINILVKGLK